MSALRIVGWPIAAGTAIGLAFFAGITVEKSGHNPLPDAVPIVGITVEKSGHNPLPDAVPIVGGKPTRGLIEPSGCSLYDIAGYHKDEGCPVAVGKSFRVGYYTVRDGWTLKPGKEGPVLTAVVVNDNPGAISGFFQTFQLKRYDGSLVEIVWCETEAFAAGQAHAMSCGPLSPDGNAPYDEVWIS